MKMARVIMFNGHEIVGEVVKMENNKITLRNAHDYDNGTDFGELTIDIDVMKKLEYFEK